MAAFTVSQYHIMCYLGFCSRNGLIFLLCYCPPQRVSQPWPSGLCAALVTLSQGSEMSQFSMLINVSYGSDFPLPACGLPSEFSVAQALSILHLSFREVCCPLQVSFSILRWYSKCDHRLFVSLFVCLMNSTSCLSQLHPSRTEPSLVPRSFCAAACLPPQSFVHVDGYYPTHQGPKIKQTVMEGEFNLCLN